MSGHRIGQRRPVYVRRRKPWHRAIQICVYHRRGEKATHHLRTGNFPPNRARKSASPASSSRMTFTATSRPPADRARNTFPMPPAAGR